MRKAKPLPDWETLNDLFWCPDDGELIWKPRVETTGYIARWNRDHAGNVAGTLNNDGYIMISINKSLYKRSRLVWAMWNDDPGDLIVDHINGITYDDHPSNLRAITQQQNMLNQKERINASGLPTGVAVTSNGMFKATVSFESRQHYIGVFTTPEEAYTECRKLKHSLYKEYIRK